MCLLTAKTKLKPPEPSSRWLESFQTQGDSWGQRPATEWGWGCAPDSVLLGRPAPHFQVQTFLSRVQFFLRYLEFSQVKEKREIRFQMQKKPEDFWKSLSSLHAGGSALCQDHNTGREEMRKERPQTPLPLRWRRKGWRPPEGTRDLNPKAKCLSTDSSRAQGEYLGLCSFQVKKIIMFCTSSQTAGHLWGRTTTRAAGGRATRAPDSSCERDSQHLKTRKEGRRHVMFFCQNKNITVTVWPAHSLRTILNEKAKL